MEAATECLKELKRSDIDEIKSMKFPPAGVKLTMEVTCIVLKVKPERKKDPGTINLHIHTNFVFNFSGREQNETHTHHGDCEYDGTFFALTKIFSQAIDF